MISKKNSVNFLYLPTGTYFPLSRCMCLYCGNKIKKGYYCSLECANLFFLANKLTQIIKLQKEGFFEDEKNSQEKITYITPSLTSFSTLCKSKNDIKNLSSYSKKNLEGNNNASN